MERKKFMAYGVKEELTDFVKSIPNLTVKELAKKLATVLLVAVVFVVVLDRKSVV